MVDNGSDPDLRQLGNTIAPFRPPASYHAPWPVAWSGAVGEFGAIREMIWTMPTPVAIEVASHHFRPETADRRRWPPCYPTPPSVPRLDPTFAGRRYILAPSGIRAVFATGPL